MAKHLPKPSSWIQSITLIAVIALFFSPFVNIQTMEQAKTDFIVFGLGLFGNEPSFKGLALARDIQLLLLSCLALCTFFVLLSKGRSQLFFLTISIFVITILPVWVMAFLEGFLRPQIGASMNYNYSVGWILLGIALIGTTFSIIQLKKEEYLPKKASGTNILDFEAK